MGLTTWEEKNSNNKSNLFSKAEEGLKVAKENTKSSIFELGEAYYAANKDKEDGEFFSLVSKVKECVEKEKLWKLYQLDLEEKTQCEHCGAIITSDSAFCNKCGGAIKPRDFSSIIKKDEPIPEDNNTTNTCPVCGNISPEGAIFCEKCGTKIETNSGTQIQATKEIEDTKVEKKCPSCGMSLEENAIFCENCGTKVQ